MNPALTENVFELENCSIRYGSFTAVRNVFLNIPRNKVTAFIGPSGCGKSTILRSLNRMNDLVEGFGIEGRIRYDGIDLYKKDIDPVEVRRRIGMVFQKPNPFPKSIYDNVVFGARVMGYRGNLDELVEKSLRQATSGMRSRTNSNSPVRPFPAVSSSGCASPAPSPSSPKSSSWMNPAPPSTPSPL